MIKFVICTIILLFIVVLIILAVRGTVHRIQDSITVHRYNSEMSRIRKEKILQEQEKQRRIRGEDEDAPKYAAGGEMDRINRRR